MSELNKGNWLVGLHYDKDARHRRETDAFFDPFDEHEMNNERGIESQVRLSNDVNVAWKQIAVAYRKWSVRYIAECYGQSEHQYHTKRLIKIANNLNELVLQETGVEMIDFGERNWQQVGADSA
jgi:hypothetical protein